jgi:hypothetical protein
VAIADKLMDQFGENWGYSSEKVTIANRLVDSGIEYLTNNGCDLNKINVDELNIKDPVLCVLGQLFNGYAIGCVSLDVREPEMFGFCAGEHNNLFISSELLTVVWFIKLREG